jgi:lysophospholipase L1-like esterase
MRLVVYGDSNSWGFPPDGCGLRFDTATRWPCVAAQKLGVDLVEEALPGRTTAHDDPQLLGAAMNGLTHLPVALKSHCPVDMLVIMLGTNDFKARFGPECDAIADNLGRLVALARQVGGGRGPWHTAPAPAIAVIVPPPLSEIVDDPAWDRSAEWRGGRDASMGLAKAVAGIAARMDFPVFDAGQVVAGSREDPIHLDGLAHVTLGLAVARWLAPYVGAGGHLRQQSTGSLAQ